MQLPGTTWAIVEQHAVGFTGREWLFEKINEFMGGPPGVLVLRGDPGSGKTAVASSIVRRARDGKAPSLTAVAFCRFGRATVMEIAQSLSDQLSVGVTGFADALRVELRPQVAVGDITVVTGDVETGATVIGLKIILDALGDERAFAYGVAAPLRRLRESGIRDQVVILVDALDEAEATAPRHLATLEDVHLIVTTRNDARVLAQFPSAIVHDLILDAPPEANDVERYTTMCLAGTTSPHSLPVLAHRIADAAAGNFLYAVYVTRSLLTSAEAATMDVPAAEQLLLPEGGLPGIYRDFLRRELAGTEEAWIDRYRPVLAPIAVALGDGLDTLQLSQVATRLAGRTVPRSEVRDVARRFSQFLEGPRPDGPFRPFHRSFADFLVDPTDNPDWVIDADESHLAIAQGLIPPGMPGSADWSAASPYAVTHLATHATAGGILDDLLADGGFLAAADPVGLRHALTGAAAGEVRTVYFCSLDALRRAGSLKERASQLELTARQMGSDALANRIAQHNPGRPWAVTWARWAATEHYIAGRHDGPIYSVAVGRYGERDIVVSAGEDGALRRWDLLEGVLLGEPMAGHRGRVNAIDVAVRHGGPMLAVSGGADTTVRLWDIRSGDPLGTPLQHSSSVRAVGLCIAASATGSRVIVVAGAADGSLAFWDVSKPTSPRIIRALDHYHEHAVQAVVPGRTQDGMTIAVTRAQGADVIWDPVTGEPLGRLHDNTAAHAHSDVGLDDSDFSGGEPVGLRAYTDALHAGWGVGPDGSPITFPGARLRAWALDLSDVEEGPGRYLPIGRDLMNDAYTNAILGNGQRIIVMGDQNGHLNRYVDLTPGSAPLGETLVGHLGPVFSVAAARAGSEEVLVSGGRDGTVRVWPLRAGLTQEDRRWRRVSALSVAALPDGQVMAVSGESEVLALRDAASGALVAESPSLGHFSTSVGLHPVSINAVTVMDDVIQNAVVAVTGDQLGRLHIWRLPNCDHLGGLHAGGMGFTKIVSGHGTGVAVTCEDSGPPRLWDLRTPAILAVLRRSAPSPHRIGEPDEWAEAVVPVIMTEGCPGYATADFAGSIRYWTADGEPAGGPIDCGIGKVDAIAAWGADGGVIAGSNNGTLCFVMPGDPPAVEPLPSAHTGRITSIACGATKGRTLVVSGSEDGIVQIWQSHELAASVVDLGSPVTAVALTNGGVLVGSIAGLVLLGIPQQS